MAILEEVEDAPVSTTATGSRHQRAGVPSATGSHAPLESVSSEEILTELLRRRDGQPTELLLSVFTFLRKKTSFFSSRVGIFY